MNSLSQIYSDPLFILIVIWTIPWKLVSLWKAAQNKHKVWYIILFLVNLAGLLSILYIFYFSKYPDLFERRQKGKKKKV